MPDNNTTTKQSNMTMAKPANYWISHTALYFTLNAMGNPEYIQASVAPNAYILCYMKDVEGLGYDAGHNYQRWQLQVSPTYFESTEAKYVYVAIPKAGTTNENGAVNAIAQIVFPSELIDIYGKNAEGTQIGSTNYFFIFLQGIISASVIDGKQQETRTWQQHIDCGSLSSDEAIAAGGADSWWQYNSADDTVTFIKSVAKAVFENISIGIANIKSLILGNDKITSVAKFGETLETAVDAIVTPDYLRQYGQKNYLSRVNEDHAEKQITFDEGLKSDTAKSTDYEHTGFPFGKGWGAMRNDGNGASMLEVDKLYVRMKAIFAELEIRKISYVGGNYLFSAAGSKVYYVEWLDANGNILEKTEDNKSLVNTYRCYMYTDDGTTSTLNYFKAGDQVRCQTFDVERDSDNAIKNGDGFITATAASSRYWWRKVNAIGQGKIAAKSVDTEYQYVDFLNIAADYAVGSDIPEVGDAMVQFGSWTDAERDGAILIVVVGDMSPAIVQYMGICDAANGGSKHFVAPEAYTRICANPKYGNIIRGKFISIADSSSDPGRNDGESVDDIINRLIDRINDIQNQADKKFELWFNSGAPHPNSATDTEANAPASNWLTESEKALHAQDLYYDTDKAPASQGGRAWRWMAHNTDSSVAYYWDEVTDQDTINALEKAADLQHQVNDIVSDNVISAGSEKSQLLIDWHEAISNYKKYTEQAEDYKLDKDEKSNYQSLSDAFIVLATVLNNGKTYTKDDCKNNAVPSWISPDADFDKDTYLAGYDSTQDVTRSSVTVDDYREAWQNFYTYLAGILKDIEVAASVATKNAQDTADKQKDRIDNIVDDGILDAAEKISVKKEFLSLWHEIVDDGGLFDKGRNENNQFYSSDIETAYNTMADTFNVLGEYLNGGKTPAWTIYSNKSSYTFNVVAESSLPSWLTKTENTPITAADYRKKWSDYYSAKAAYLGMLAKNAQESADKAQETAEQKANVFVTSENNPPKPPYKKGDLWVQTSNKNNIMVCINTRSTGSYVVSDWADLSDIYGNVIDPRTQLAALAEKVYDMSSGYIKHNGSVKVYIETGGTSGNNGDIKFDGTFVYRYDNGSWTSVSNTGLLIACYNVYNIIGARTITIYNSTNLNANKYDLVTRPISWTDRLSGNSFDGNIEIYMRGDGVWELLRESSQTIFAALGDEIYSVVYGSDGEGGNVASGVRSLKDLTNLFAEEFNEDLTLKKTSGLLTTADGNTLYAKMQGVTSNIFMGLATGDGWTLEQSCDADSKTFTADDREFKIVNFYPVGNRNYSDPNNLAYSTLAAPITRVEKGKRYIISFYARVGNGVQFSLRIDSGAKADNLTTKQGVDIAEMTRIDNDYIYSNGYYYYRYYYVFQAANDYIRIRFINAVKSTFVNGESKVNNASNTVEAKWPYSDTSSHLVSTTYESKDGGKTLETTYTYDYYTGSQMQYSHGTVTGTTTAREGDLWLRKLQLEKVIDATLSDKTSTTILPSDYSEDNVDMESYIKQTAESIELFADKVIFSAGHSMNIKSAGLLTIDASNFTLDKDGYITAKGAKLESCVVSGTLSANLMYGKTKDLTATFDYTIDPLNDPAYCYFYKQPGVGVHYIRLPKASDYDGLEVRIFFACDEKILTRVGFPYVVVAAKQGDHLYAKFSVQPDTKSSNGHVHYYNDLNVYYTDYKDNTLFLTTNTMCIFKSMGGSWYAISGYFGNIY